MKNWVLIHSTLAALTVTALGCAPAEENLNKRQSALARLSKMDNGDAKPGEKPSDPANPDQPSDDQEPGKPNDPAKPNDPSNPGTEEPAKPIVPVVNVGALKFEAAKGLEVITAEDQAKIKLISKIGKDDIVLFGAEGKSWHYLPLAEKDKLVELDPIVVAPEGSTLYTLPDRQFWFLSKDDVGRRKSGDNSDPAGKQVQYERFQLKNFKGDASQVKALFVSRDALILSMGTHIIVLTMKDNKAFVTQLEIATQPVDLSELAQAGLTEGNGFWFKGKAGLAVLLPASEDGGFLWSKVNGSVDPVDFSAMGLWLDAVSGKALGTNIGLSAKGLYSLTAAP